MKTNLYVILGWLGPRRGPDPRSKADPTLHLRKHLEGLAQCSQQMDPFDILLVLSGEEKDILEQVGIGSGVDYLIRDNFGLSYGAFSDAYKSHGREYQYLAFVEDDYVPQQNPFTALKPILLEGGYAYVGGMLNEELGLHMAIPHGIITSASLEEIYRCFGKIPHGDEDGYHIHSQVFFSQAFLRCGYTLGDFSQKFSSPYWTGEKIVTFGDPALPPLFVPVQSL